MGKFRVLMTGGGTGGHIYPLVAVAAELQILSIKNGINLDLRYLGSCGSYKEVLEANNIRVQKIAQSKLRRYFSIANFIDGPKFLFGLLQALFKMFWFMPDILFSKGGPGALSVVLAAKFYRIPILVHESDTVPGLTNIISGRYAKLIATSFETASKYFPSNKEVILVGNPIRSFLIKNTGSDTQHEIKSFLDFKPELPLVLVMGGSQGAMKINEFILDNLINLLQFTQIFHQTGKNNYEEVVKGFDFLSEKLPEEIKSRYHALDYFENDIKNALFASDVVVSRSGGAAIFEIAAFGKPSILIPLPPEVAASDHQTKNAYEYAVNGAAIVIEEANFLPNLFVSQLQGLLSDPERMSKMSEAALKFSKPEAALKLAEIILRLGGYDESYLQNKS